MVLKTPRILKSYKTHYTDPIVLQRGEAVKLGEEEKEEKWKGWIWAVSKDKKGWIPKQIIKITDDGKSGEVLESYTAKELDVEEGDLVQRIRSLNGWTWSKNLRTKDEGWIPDEVIE